MAVSSVAVVSVPVSDQERAKRFYVETLGLVLVADNAMPGMRWVQVAPAGGGTALTLVTWFPSMPAGSMQGLVLRCDDLDAEYRRITAAGVSFETAPHTVPYAKAEAVLRDPDGNGIVLQQV
jgi:catechol 2,3-dioxygenase-like lactoylglutathione lyase family enzyme